MLSGRSDERGDDTMKSTTDGRDRVLVAIVPVDHAERPRAVLAAAARSRGRASAAPSWRATAEDALRHVVQLHGIVTHVEPGDVGAELDLQHVGRDELGASRNVMLPTARGASPGAPASHSVWVSPSVGRFDPGHGLIREHHVPDVSGGEQRARSGAGDRKLDQRAGYTGPSLDLNASPSANAYRLRSGEAMPIRRVRPGSERQPAACRARTDTR